MTRDERLARDGVVSPVLFYRPGDEWGVFSNFSDHPVSMINPWTDETQVYWTSEHYFQAMKATSAQAHHYIANTRSATFTKSRGRQTELRLDWSEVSYKVMVDVVRAKAAQHAEMREALAATGTRHIYEDSPVDAIWGWRHGDSHHGLNLLGKVLIGVRDE